MCLLVDIDVLEYAKARFKEELDMLYYPSIEVLPLTPDAEAYREQLIDDGIFRYGVIEHNFNYNGEIYLAILINND